MSDNATMKNTTIHDMTTGSPARLIMQFMIPMFLGNIFQQFYNMADAIIVGRLLGEDALADADVLEARGHAPAEHLTALRILTLVLLERLFQALFALVDGIHHAHAVFEHLAADRRRARIDSVAAAQLERVDAQLFRHHVHRGLDRNRRLIDAVAAERAALQIVVADR